MKSSTFELGLSLLLIDLIVKLISSFRAIFVQNGFDKCSSFVLSTTG